MCGFLKDYILLRFNEDEKELKLLAQHYAAMTGDELVIAIFNGDLAISNDDEAQKLVEGFWEMTDLATDDYLHNVAVAGIENQEHWMYKLLNKVYGYCLEQGYGELWRTQSRGR